MTNTSHFITNTNQSHKEKILSLFREAETISIAVGFLRPSGLNNIENALINFCSGFSKKITFYIGTGLGETDPKTLQKLVSILNNNQNCKLVLCTPDAGIFHPKIYVFEKQKNATIITGSANLSEWGLLISDEVSFITETTTNSPEYLQLKSYLQNLFDTYFTADILTLIKEYKKQVGDYQKDNRPAFHFRRKKKSSVDGIDMPRLRRYFEAYLNSSGFINVGEREGKYSKAKRNLEELASDRTLSAQQFHDLFGPLVGHRGYEKLWHSGSIQRTTHKTLDYIPGFRKIVRLAERDIKLPVSNVFDKMINIRRTMKLSNQIHGVGENILTEILMTYNPNKFANLNVNPIDVLAFVGKKFPSVSSFTGLTYEEYVNLLTLIKTDLGLRSFLEIDSFFNYVYWNILERV
jgi:HKD family nuclease